MKLVRENIDFKRGLNPKKGLEIGSHRKIKLENPEWDEVKNLPDGFYQIILDDLSSKDYLIVQIKGDQCRYSTVWQSTKEHAINRFIIQIDKGIAYWRDLDQLKSHASYTALHTIIEKIDLSNEIKESLDFKRRMNPQKSLKIGEYGKKINPTWEDIVKMPDGFWLEHSNEDNSFSVLRKYHQTPNKYRDNWPKTNPDFDFPDWKTLHFGSLNQWQETPEKAIEQAQEEMRRDLWTMNNRPIGHAYNIYKVTGKDRKIDYIEYIGDEI